MFSSEIFYFVVQLKLLPYLLPNIAYLHSLSDKRNCAVLYILNEIKSISGVVLGFTSADQPK